MAELQKDREALLRHHSLQDSSTYDSFSRWGDPRNLHLMAITSHPGQTNVISTVVHALPRDVSLTVIARKDVSGVFGDPRLGLNKITDESLTPATLIASGRPNIGLTGFSSEPDAELAMTVGAKFPVVWIQDSADGILHYYQHILGLPTKWAPNYIFAANSFGVEREKANNPQQVNIELTGNPYYDRIPHWDLPRTRSIMRTHYGIPESRRVLLYMAVPGVSSPEAFRWFVEGSLQTGGENDQLIYGRHPRETRNLEPEAAAARIRRYTDAARLLPNGLIDASDFNPTDLKLTYSKADCLIMMSDITDTTISSVGIDAIYGGVASIMTLAQRIVKQTEDPSFKTPPEITLGAGLSVRSQKGMLRALHNLSEFAFRQDLQGKMSLVKPVPWATERVVNRLLEIGAV